MGTEQGKLAMGVKVPDSLPFVNFGSNIYDNQNHLVAEIYEGDPDYIVHACNTYPALVEALSDARRDIRILLANLDWLIQCTGEGPGSEDAGEAMTDAPRTELSERMHQLAEQRSDLPPDWLEKARAFDEAAAGFYAEPQTVTVMKFVGCFARARRAWCEVTGEPLI